MPSNNIIAPSTPWWRDGSQWIPPNIFSMTGPTDGYFGSACGNCNINRDYRGCGGGGKKRGGSKNAAIPNYTLIGRPCPPTIGGKKKSSRKNRRKTKKKSRRNRKGGRWLSSFPAVYTPLAYNLESSDSAYTNNNPWNSQSLNEGSLKGDSLFGGKKRASRKNKFRKVSKRNFRK